MNTPFSFFSSLHKNIYIHVYIIFYIYVFTCVFCFIFIINDLDFILFCLIVFIIIRIIIICILFITCFFFSFSILQVTSIFLLSMGFLFGPAPIRRTLPYLQNGKLVFRNRVKIIEIHYNMYWKGYREDYSHIPYPQHDAHFGLRQVYLCSFFCYICFPFFLTSFIQI